MRLFLLFTILFFLGCQEKSTLLSKEELMDPAACKDCHPNHYEEWAGSMHAYAADDPVFLAMNARGQRETNGELGDFCVQCHAPMAVLTGATKDGLNLEDVPQHLKGVTCYFCHSVEKVEGVHNNPLVLATDGVMRGSISDPIENPAHKSAHSDLYERADRKSAYMCGSCHDVVTPSGLLLERSFAEWKETIFAADEIEEQNTCSQCHMPSSDGVAANYEGVPLRKVHDHSFPGVDVAISPWPGKEKQRAAIQKSLDSTLISQICLVENGQYGPEAHVMLQNVAAGHSFPSGAAHDRRAWVQLEAFKGQETIHSSGVIDDETPIVESPDLDLWLMRDMALKENGEEAHMFWEIEKTISTLLPGLTTLHDIDEMGELIHIPVETRQVQTYFLSEMPDRISMKVRLRPMALEIIDDLIESGDLDPKYRNAFPTFDLAGTVLEWNEEEAEEEISPLGAPARCVPAFLPQGSTDPLAEADVLTVGLEKTGMDQRFSARLLGTTPAPPSIGDNSWQLEILDSEGTPVEGAIIRAGSWMPDHFHGSAIIGQSTEEGSGIYTVSPIDLFMPGLWEITFHIEDSRGVKDSVVFKFWTNG